jgi:hypothetical protein
MRPGANMTSIDLLCADTISRLAIDEFSIALSPVSFGFRVRLFEGWTRAA